MKKHLIYWIALAGVALAMTCTVSAQDLADQLRVDIPFSFHAGAERFPAGVYTFGVDPLNHQVTVEQDSTGRSLFLQGAPADSAPGQPDVTFDRLGRRHNLTEVQGADVGVAFAQTSPGD
jgi:hypothetical protein